MWMQQKSLNRGVKSSKPHLQQIKEVEGKKPCDSYEQVYRLKGNTSAIMHKHQFVQLWNSSDSI